MDKKNKDEIFIDPAIERFYATGNEKDRLTTHRLERERTLQILKKLLPQAPALIFDVGGAAGVYSFILAQMGYAVHLIDPIALHIEQAKEHAISCNLQLASYRIGDARKIEQEDSSVDVVLFLGPLYHLIEEKERLLALKEAYRILKPGGLLFAAGVSRSASLMDAMHKGTIYSKLEALEKGLETGEHQKSSEETSFTFLYLHTPDQLKKEVEQTGFENVVIRAIEGPVWDKQVIEPLQQDEDGWQKLLTLLEKIEKDETIIGASAHILAVGHVGNPKK